jgi:hypothetical protein
MTLALWLTIPKPLAGFTSIQQCRYYETLNIYSFSAMLTLKNPKKLDIPSWVPTWSGDINAAPLKQGHASGQCQIRCGIESAQGMLSLQGLVVDDITCNLGGIPALASLYEKRGQSEAFEDFLALTEQVFKVEDYLGDPDVDHILCSTFLSDPNWPASGEQHAEKASRAFQVFMNHLVVAFRPHMMPFTGPPAIGTLTNPAIIADDDKKVADYIVTQARTNSRSICITKGKRLCPAPKDAQSGDAVTIIYGGQWLFVLRAIDSGIEFIGDAYIHGLMSGEGLEGDHQEQIFDII